ncbi:hypothetical protein ABH900_000690 [Stenotrophomonas sp. AN71]|uniref:SLATT domain-containing protein n=1 Tax=Stenotrophomonas sp. AN71 TaxID=3156253 RepID=UPI003D227241
MFNGNQDSLPPLFFFLERVVRDKIWFTYKARIKAHERLERMDFHSQLLLVWYAILSSILAILSIRYPTILGDNTDILGAILSIGLLAISLSVTNRDFRGRAMLMRGNYLHLQKLYNDIQPTGPTLAEQALYAGLLRDSENHTSMDDILARVLSTGLTSRIPTKIEYARGIASIILRYILIISLYATPLIAAYCAMDTCQ